MYIYICICIYIYIYIYTVYDIPFRRCAEGTLSSLVDERSRSSARKAPIEYEYLYPYIYIYIYISTYMFIRRTFSQVRRGHPFQFSRREVSQQHRLLVAFRLLLEQARVHFAVVVETLVVEVDRVLRHNRGAEFRSLEQKCISSPY